MTVDEFLERPERERDALVAEHVAGARWIEKDGYHSGGYIELVSRDGYALAARHMGFEHHFDTLPEYTTDDGSAWGVVADNTYGGWPDTHKRSDETYVASIRGPNSCGETAEADSPALTICIAALKAKGVIV